MLGCDWCCCCGTEMRLVVLPLCRYDLACLEDDRAGVAGVAIVSTLQPIKQRCRIIRVAGNVPSEVSGRFVIEVVSSVVLFSLSRWWSEVVMLNAE